MNLQQYVEYIKKNSRYSYLYHFTDEANLSSIKEHGILSTEKRDEQGVTPKFRGGNNTSYHADKKNDIEKYVCLSFTSDHPLCYLARIDGRLPSAVCLAINPDILLKTGVHFANGVANADETELTLIADAIDLIDIEVIYKWTDWNDSEIHARLQFAKKCEILVPDCIPVSMIKGFV